MSTDALLARLFARISEIEQRGPYPDEVLRLCRAHRRIVEQYQRAQELLTDGRFTGSVAESNEAAARSLRVAVEALAVGLGVVEEDR